MTEEALITYEEYSRKKKEIREKLTPEFVDTLREVCKLIGWSTDYVVVQEAYWEIVRLAELDQPYDESLLAAYRYDHTLRDPYDHTKPAKPVTELSDDELHTEWRKIAASFDSRYQRCRDLEVEIYRREHKETE